MSATGGRCPNIAWAHWHGRKIGLPKHERWVFTSLAERADADLHCNPTLPVLALDAAISPGSTFKAVHALEARGLIKIESKADGLHYYIQRPDEAVQNPRPVNGNGFSPPWRNADAADIMEPPENIPDTILHAVQDAPVDVSESILPPVQDADPSILSPVQDASYTPCKMYNESPPSSPHEGTLLRNDALCAHPLPDVRRELFREGLAIVRGLTGKPDGSARALLGKFCKAGRDDCAHVLAVLRQAVDLRPAEPISFVFGALNPKPRVSAFDQMHAELGTRSLWLDDDDPAPLIEEPPPLRMIAGGAR